MRYTGNDPIMWIVNNIILTPIISLIIILLGLILYPFVRYLDKKEKDDD